MKKETIQILYKPYFDFPLEKIDYEVGSKMIDHHRLSSVYSFKKTPENIDKANEHNRILHEIEILQDKLKEITHSMEKL
jgi:hypothetical protein